MKIKLDPGAVAPTRAHELDAGLDLYAKKNVPGCTATEYIIPPHGSATIDTGVHVQLPHGTAGVLISKSGLNVKCNLTSTGLIDEGYTGSIVVKLYNHGDYSKIIHPGDKISQLVITHVRHDPIEIVDEIDGGDRGDNGFGSTGA